ncbi:MAG: class I tRNA ligase family protein, partial [Magnetococcales bacterium]|nr:class I tRNA ligase family protein [Magnetococcales bacterium]
DVLDTWFSSALWPFATLGWPKLTQEMEEFYPTNVLVTAFDIIFFWVARMVMMGLKFTKQVPFHDVYITGLVRDSEGNKMSKSKGNVLDPLDLIDGIDLDTLVAKRTQDMMQPHLAKKIEKATRKEFPDGIPPFGADALRFTMASLATQGRDIKFDLGRIEGYRNFCNKLWNATRFVLMNSEGQNCGADSKTQNYSYTDRWILSRLQQVKEEVASSIEEYRFNDAANVAYQFVWGSYCDWYLEMVKPVIYGDDIDEADKIASRHCMVGVLEESLRLLHPLMPFITEELWQKVAGLVGRGGDSIMIAPWTLADASLIDLELEKELAWVMSLVTAVRTIRAEMDISPGKKLDILVQGSKEMVTRLERHSALIVPLAKLASWQVLEGEAPDGAATGVVGEMQIFIPLAGLIDIEAETARLQKGLQKLDKDLERVVGKLTNPNFLAKAKPEVVAKEQGKQQELEEKKNSLTEALLRIEKLRSAS